MINFCHIMTTKLIPELSSFNKIHLVLAHLVERDELYREYYKNIEDPIIMDNSAFEMFKEGKPMYPSEKLIELGKMINAQYIVLSDYPNEKSDRTIEKSQELIPVFKKEGFKTFFVPQSRKNDLEDYINCWEYALNNQNIDLIGNSIIGAPNAFGVESGNKLQRFLSRWRIFNILKERSILKSTHLKKIHMLGMVDGPREIELVKDFHPFIYSWDSSAAIWAGIHNIRFDNSPTGLVDGKFEKPVDFNSLADNNSDILFNIEFIRRLL